MRKVKIMKNSNHWWREIVCGALSLAVVGGMVAPLTARAADKGCGNCEKPGKVAEHRREMRAMREKMLSQVRTEDAALEKMVAELNKAPEAKKVDLEAAILTKLVAQHHEMLGDWESLHAGMKKWKNEHKQMGKTEPTAAGSTHG